jgi:hypothetical protein
MSEDLEKFQGYLSDSLAEYLGVPLAGVEAAVRAVTDDWAVEAQHMRPVTDPHERFAIYTPWERA